jgi:hypothetical protein
MWECIEFYSNEFVMGDVKFMQIHSNEFVMGRCDDS